MDIVECNRLVEYWQYLDYVEIKLRHPSPKFRVITYEEWLVIQIPDELWYMQ